MHFLLSHHRARERQIVKVSSRRSQSGEKMAGRREIGAFAESLSCAKADHELNLRFEGIDLRRLFAKMWDLEDGEIRAPWQFSGQLSDTAAEPDFKVTNRRQAAMHIRGMVRKVRISHAE